MYIIYLTSTGEILYLLIGNEETLAANIQSGESSLEYTDFIEMEKFYILDGEVTEKPTQTTSLDKTTLLADGVDTITITNAPANCHLLLRNKTTGETVEGTFSNTEEIFSTSAGTLELTFSCFPYLDLTTTVEAI
jgi:hypothetical protein